MTTTKTRELEHHRGCEGPRQLDLTRYDDRGITTQRCVDCGAHLAVKDDGEVLADPIQPGPFNSDKPKPSIFDGITIERMEKPR